MSTNLLLNCLRALERKMSKQIEWNFGYCPNEPYFNKLLDKRNALLEKLKEVNRPAYMAYSI